MEISLYIKKLREERELSINQLSLQSEVSAAHISRIENKKREPSPEILKKLAGPLLTTYEDLMQVAGYFDVTVKESLDFTPNIKSDTNLILGDRLKDLRLEKGMTQEQVSKDLKMNRATYAHYETGRREPDFDTLKLLADYFDTSVDELLGFDHSQSPETTLNLKFGERLKTLREEKGLTQNDVAEFLSVGRATIAGYETKGKQPDYEKLLRLSDFLEVTTDYLLGRTDSKDYISKPSEHFNPDDKEYKIVSDAIKTLKRKLIDNDILKDDDILEEYILEAVTQYGENAAIEILKHRKKQDS